MDMVITNILQDILPQTQQLYAYLTYFLCITWSGLDINVEDIDHACFGKWYTPTEWKTELELDKERKPQVICVDGAGNFRFGPFNKKKGAEDNQVLCKILNLSI